MAFFKFRKDSEEHSAPAPAPESVETLRKRARYRLAGAAILVLAGVIGFPMLFDNQPRPIAVNIPIDIPDKAQSRPLPAPLPAAPGTASASSAAQSQASAALAAASDASRVPAPVRQAKPAQKEEVVIAGPGAKAATKEELRAELRADAKAASARGAVAQESKPAPVSPAPATAAPAPASTAAKAADAAKAQALLDGKPAATDAPVRFVVQFGSYSDAGKAHEARLKVEHAGIKTYSQMVQGPDGKKYRVRVGPFEHRADADKAVEKIKKLNFPTAILEL